VKIKDLEFEPFVTEAELAEVVRRTAERINADYAGRKVVLCPVLTGSFMFFADLARQLTVENEVCFVKYTSYEGTASSGRVEAPLPFPAITDSRSGPAVETTKSPAKSESRASTAAAFSFRADSPVMITAPVSTCSGRYPAAAYSAATISRTASESIRAASSSGVVYTTLLYNTSLSTISTLGTLKKPIVFFILILENTSCVVDVPISIPTLKTSAKTHPPRGSSANNFLNYSTRAVPMASRPKTLIYQPRHLASGYRNV
jgi:hypothetical protein